MSQLYASGPVEIWVGIVAGVPSFLGFGESAPRIQLVRRFRDIHSDQGGDMVPTEKGYGGEMGVVSVQLNKWNEGVLSVIQDVATTLTGGPSVRGTNDPGEVGTLMLTEGVAYPLWLRFPFSAKAAYSNPANGAQPGGYRWAAAFLEGPDDFQELGPPKARRMGLTWSCLRAVNTGVSNAFGTGRLLLYDHNMSALPATAV